MNIKKMSKEELELLSYNDLAYQILKYDKNSKSTVELFKEIQKLLDLSEEEYLDKIGDFYTILTTDKRFHPISKGFWDLKERNIVKVVIEDEDEDISEETEEEEIDDVENEDNQEIEVKDFNNDDDIVENELEEFGVNEEEILEEDSYDDK